MIKLINYNEKIQTVSDGKTLYQTDFVADDSSDITAANATGSEYLKYPGGSTIYDAANKKLYILNASQTEYKEC